MNIYVVFTLLLCWHSLVGADIAFSTTDTIITTAAVTTTAAATTTAATTIVPSTTTAATTTAATTIVPTTAAAAATTTAATTTTTFITTTNTTTITTDTNPGATFDPKQFCTLIINGTKFKDPRYCNTWIECVNNEPITGICDKNQFYDRETEKCVPEDDIECLASTACLLNPNGFEADPYSCNGYYYCNNGSGSFGICPEGMNFNPGTKNCIRNIACQVKMSPDSICNIVADGIFVKSTDSCNGYQICWQGKVLDGTCPGTFYFNAKLANCDYPKNVECTITEKPPLADNGECPKANIFVSDGSSCNGYYYCKQIDNGQIELLHGACDDGFFFSPIYDGCCLPRAQVRCKYDRCVGLGENSIQLANESDDGCRGFSICQNGTSIGSELCPQNEYFDESTQMCTTQQISYPACELSPTTTNVESSTDSSDMTTTLS